VELCSLLAGRDVRGVGEGTSVDKVAGLGERLKYRVS